MMMIEDLCECDRGKMEEGCSNSLGEWAISWDGIIKDSSSNIEGPRSSF